MVPSRSAPVTAAPEFAAGFRAIPAPLSERSVGDVFDDIAARSGTRTAIRCRDETVSFAGLAARVDGLARVLLEAVPGRRRPVLLLLDDPVDQVTAMLAVLQAGNFFVPLSTGNPPTRLRRHVAHCQAAAIVTGDVGAEMVERIAVDLPRIHVSDAKSGAGAARPLEAVSPADPAYLVFTSGSTGEPKGVMHSHRNLLHHVAKYTRLVGLTECDRVAWVAGYSHAASISDVFPTLLTGAVLVPLQPDREGLGSLHGRLRAEEVSVFHTAPTLLRKLAQTMAAEERPGSMRVARLAGEPAFGRDVRCCHALFGNSCRVLNTLGTTELNLVRALEVAADTVPDDARLPVGFAVADTEVSIVDDTGSPVAAGTNGRIAIRSRYLSTGYWRQYELTCAAFSVDPADPELRTYITGDLGRLEPDGCLVHLGRDTERVKVRGQGVDLREVEQVVASVATGLEVAVVDIPDTPTAGDTTLVAWLSGDAGDPDSAVQLRRRLADHLPAYMIPTHFGWADVLPMTRSGKIDRGELRRRGVPGRAERQAPQQAAGDDRLGAVAALWESLLSTPIGPADHFFDLGGDSLLAMTMLWEVERRFNVKVSPVAFARDPTPRGLTHCLSGADESGRLEVLLPQRTTGHLPPLFFIAGGGGGADAFPAAYERMFRYLPEERPVYGLVASMLDSSGMDRLIERYVDAIREANPGGPYYVAGECVGALVAFNVACRLEREGGTVAQVVLLDPPRAARLAEHTLGIRRLRKWLLRRRSRLNLLVGRTTHHLGTLRRVPLEQWPVYVRRGLQSAGRLQQMGRRAETEAVRRVRYQQAAYRFQPGGVLRGGLSIIYAGGGDFIRYESDWRALASGDVSIRVVDGDHRAYIRGALARSTAACLARCLEQGVDE